MKRPPTAFVAPGWAHLVKRAKLQARLDVRARVVEDPRIRPGMMIIFPHFLDMVEVFRRMFHKLASAMKPLVTAFQAAARSLTQFANALASSTKPILVR